MMNNKIRIAIAAFAALLAVPLASLAQTAQQTAVSSGISLFDKGDYAAACDVLAPVAKGNERDAKINFYYGAAEAMTGRNLDDALNRLHLAQLRSFRKNDANLYIGRAYQLKCEYDRARSAFAKFTPTCKVDSLARMAEQFDTECQSSTLLASKIFNVRVGSKTTMPRVGVTQAYGVSKECGMVCANSHFFQSDIDPDGLMYMTERADAVYFSIADDDGYSRLMKMEKLIGGWGEMTKLRGLEGEWDDIAPVLMTDGVTVYFASNRPGGMGGYDIYRTTYDPETRTYSEPVNMGVPFNSAFDDFLFVADEFNQSAWFASNRETAGTDSVVVYQMAWDGQPVRSSAKSTEEIQSALALNLDPELVTRAKLTQPASANSSTSRAQSLRDPSYALKDAFRLVICDSLTYTQWEHFRSAQAARTYRQVVSATAQKDSLVNLMAQQRKDFMALSSSIERNAKLQDLLKTERTIYTLEDEITEKTEAARNDEISEISHLIANGTYTPLSKIKVVNKNAPKLSGTSWLRPSNFSVYSPVFFRDAHRDEDEEVMDLFTAQQRLLVEEQDSLRAWARIVSLEADKLDALAISRETSDEDAVALAAKADAYRLASAQLSSDAYDRLFSLYEAKYKVLVVTLSGYDPSELTELYDKSVSLFKAVDAADIKNSDAEKREAALASKRRGIASMVKCLQRYIVHADGTFPLPAGDGSTTETTTTTDSITETEAEAGNFQTDTSATQMSNQSEQATDDTGSTSKVDNAQPTAGQSATTSDTPQAEVSSASFRIQLGAFKNRPAALDKLPDPSQVSFVFLAERGITRYYYGAYPSAESASADIAAARAAGFSGAFATKI